MVVSSRMVGKELNSSGLRMNTAVIRIRMEKLSEKASEISSIQGGRGTISTTRIAMIPMARPRSDLRMSENALAGVKSNPLAGAALEISAILFALQSIFAG